MRTGRAISYYRFVSVKIVPSRLMSTRLIAHGSAKLFRGTFDLLERDFRCDQFDRLLLACLKQASALDCDLLSCFTMEDTTLLSRYAFIAAYGRLIVRAPNRDYAGVDARIYELWSDTATVRLWASRDRRVRRLGEPSGPRSLC